MTKTQLFPANQEVLIEERDENGKLVPNGFYWTGKYDRVFFLYDYDKFATEKNYWGTSQSVVDWLESKGYTIRLKTW